MLLGKNTQLLAGCEDQGRRTVRANCDIHRVLGTFTDTILNVMMIFNMVNFDIS